MDLFKLIFHHDLLLEQLEGADQNRNLAKVSLSLEDFMKPMPTYSRFYLSGTHIPTQSFALSSIHSFTAVLASLSQLFADYRFFCSENRTVLSLLNAIDLLGENSGCILSKKNDLPYFVDLVGKEYIREYGSAIKVVLENDDIALFKIQASNGYDIQLFSRTNIYPQLFLTLKPFVSPEFRLFSMNGKKMSSDRFFYFETYNVNNPPHGIEEVFASTTI